MGRLAPMAVETSGWPPFCKPSMWQIFSSIKYWELLADVGRRRDMRFRGMALATAIVVLLAAGGCTDGDGGEATNLGAGQESMPTPPTLRPRPVYKDGELPPPPVGPGAEVGKAYPYELYTHCGIEWAHIDGVWWKTGRLWDGVGNPPRNQGWGNPFDDGTLTLLDEDTAEFVSASGNRVRFARTDEQNERICA